MAAQISFPAFFLLWAERQQWDVPQVHWRVVEWLASRGEHAVLRMFRGGAKSTILAVYNAWRYHCDPAYRILHQSESDPTAYKTSRDTKAVLSRHPLTRDLSLSGKIEQWWVPGNDDARNASMYAKGIMSNVVSSRADEIQNDDVEVPRNIGNAEARERLRHRLGEQTHILVPGGRLLYVGTPHTYDSIYDEHEKLGADCLTIRLYGLEHRIDEAIEKSYRVPFEPQIVFSGIGRGSRVLVAGVDYTYGDGSLRFKKAPKALIDCYAECAWPERFDAVEMTKRRRKTRTVNEWDSQYQLHAKPLTQTRLDPSRMVPYKHEPVLRRANDELMMFLGDARIVSASLHMDPASGKVNSDVSALALVLQDDYGRRYIHRVEQLLGDVAIFSGDGQTIIGGQVTGVCDMVADFHLTRVTVETNGIGGHVPAVLKAALKQRKLFGVGVSEETAVGKKNLRILQALEPLLLSGEQLWAHESVLDGPLPEQMRDWNPSVTVQPDDYVDAVAGAIAETPERISKIVRDPDGAARDNWQPHSGTYAVLTE